MVRRGGWRLTFKIAFAVLGAVSGVSIFVSFIYYKNINAAVWGLLSAIFAIMVLRLHIAYRRNTLIDKFPVYTLRRLKYFGIFASLAAIIAAVTYFTLAMVLKQGYKIENDGYMPAGIFTLLTLKWTAFLFCHSKHYEEMYTEDGEKNPVARNEQINQNYDPAI